MATITPIKPSIAGATVTRVATAPAGDQIVWEGDDILLHFENGHASPVTVNLVPVQSTTEVPGVGPVTNPNRSLAIAAGAEGVFFIPRHQANAYVNSSRRIPVTYTDGHASLTVMAARV